MGDQLMIEAPQDGEELRISVWIDGTQFAVARPIAGNDVHIPPSSALAMAQEAIENVLLTTTMTPGLLTAEASPEGRDLLEQSVRMHRWLNRHRKAIDQALEQYEQMHRTLHRSVHGQD